MSRERSVTDSPDFGDIPDPLGGRAGSASQAPRPPPRLALTPPTRGRTRATRATALALALAYDGALIAALQTHTAGRPSATMAAGLAIPLVAGAVALTAGARSGSRGLGLSSPTVPSAAIAAPVLFVVATLLLLPGGPADDRFVAHAMTCVLNGAILATVPIALVAVAWRRAFAAASGWRTVALGVAAGSLATTSLALICPDASAAHVAVAHGAAILLGGVAGGLLARWTTIR
jgi:hypothetical protein